MYHTRWVTTLRCTWSAMMSQTRSFLLEASHNDHFLTDTASDLSVKHKTGALYLLCDWQVRRHLTCVFEGKFTPVFASFMGRTVAAKKIKK